MNRSIKLGFHSILIFVFATWLQPIKAQVKQHDSSVFKVNICNLENQTFEKDTFRFNSYAIFEAPDEVLIKKKQVRGCGGKNVIAEITKGIQINSFLVDEYNMSLCTLPGFQYIRLIPIGSVPLTEFNLNTLIQ